MTEENTNLEEQNAQTEEVKVHKPRKRFIAMGIGAIVAIACGFFIHDALMYQSTDDAYVETTTVQVAPRVSGQITDVYITDNQQVKEGQLVAKIDNADYKARLEEKKQSMKEFYLTKKMQKQCLQLSRQI